MKLVICIQNVNQNKSAVSYQKQQLHRMKEELYSSDDLTTNGAIIIKCMRMVSSTSILPSFPLYVQLTEELLTCHFHRQLERP